MTRIERMNEKEGLKGEDKDTRIFFATIEMTRETDRIKKLKKDVNGEKTKFCI